LVGAIEGLDQSQKPEAISGYACYVLIPACSARASTRMSKPKTDTVAVMTDKRAVLLRELAIDAYEPEAFRPNLTKAEAELRINVLKAKLKLMGEPPHIL
jgi:hypothetical protein